MHFKYNRSNSVQLSQMSCNQMFCAICFFTYRIRPSSHFRKDLEIYAQILKKKKKKNRPCIPNESLESVA